MPIPADHQMVSAADAGPGAPFTSTECPSDDAEVQAADIRRVAATMHANDDAYAASTAAGLALKVAKAGDTMTGDLNLDGASLWVTVSGGDGGDITAGGNLEVTGTTTLSDTVTVDASLLLTGANQVKGASTRTYVRVAELPVFDHAYWSRPILDQALYPARVRSAVEPSATDPAQAVAYGLRVPNEAILEEVTVYLDVVAGHAALPANMPRVVVVLVDIETGTFLTLGNVTDATTLPAYEDRHAIIVTVPPTVIQANKHKVHVIAYGESGANHVIGMVFDLPLFQFSRAAIGEE